MILLAKYYVYVNQKKQSEPDIYEFLLECKNRMHLKQQIMPEKQRSNQFEREWGELNDCFM
jgi:hypothetical protein